MKRNWMQLLAAFIMGMLLPALAMQVGQAMVSAREEIPTQPQTQQTTEVPPPAEQSSAIPVLITGGTVQIIVERK